MKDVVLVISSLVFAEFFDGRDAVGRLQLTSTTAAGGGRFRVHGI